MFLVAAALVSSWLITVSEIATQVVDLLKPFMGSQTLLLAAIMVIIVIVGTALDMTSTILILTPILMPIVKAAGIDPVYFGVLFIVNNSIGLITPPVGVVLNVLRALHASRWPISFARPGHSCGPNWSSCSSWCCFRNSSPCPPNGSPAEAGTGSITLRQQQGPSCVS
jgi:hypothetical protein